MNYMVTDTSMTSVADHIRAKAGLTGGLTFPDQWNSAIDNIRTGADLTLTVSVVSGASVTATNGADTVTGTSVGGTCVLKLPHGGTWTVTAENAGSSATPVTVTVQDNYPVALTIPQIYGVKWYFGPGGTTQGDRTDDAVNFSDPSPSIYNGTGSSPFDNLYPWNQMTIEERTGGTMVKEPKYWFKWTLDATDDGQWVKLQIANYPAEGFHVDPVNMDRGDGLGELDYSYIGRYHCANGTYKSTTNAEPQASITRSAARTSIHNLGANIWQMDFAQMWYVNMLYLVEFANWNSQFSIGYGCSASKSKANNGQTDAMQYHTGTTAAGRTTYGFCQYRNIEGLWDNVLDCIDGCYYTSSGLNIILNPADFSDTKNGTLVGAMPVTGSPVSWKFPAISGFEWAGSPLTTRSGGGLWVQSTWEYVADSPCLIHGGSYFQTSNSSMFLVYSAGAEDAYPTLGCRIQERPPKA